MLNYLKKLLQGNEPAAPTAQPVQSRRAGAHAEVRRGRATRSGADEAQEIYVSSHVESVGPGKNVLIRNKYQREDTGTHETLKILDDSMVDSGEETGIDPYNSGSFDRSKNWDKRFRS